MFQLLNFLRPHHWIKNFLIFVQLLPLHQFDIFTIKNTILAFISFSLIASCGYVFNDLLDAKTDKLNPYKKKTIRDRVNNFSTKFDCNFNFIFYFNFFQLK